MNVTPKKITTAEIADLTQADSAITVSDTIAEQLKELFLIRHPKYKFDSNYQSELEAFVQKQTDGDINNYGSWFYFAAEKNIIHYLPETEYIETKTARNKNLITDQEQETFYNSTVAIAGLSVGSHVAQTVTMMSGCREIKIADPDAIDLSNLNRIRVDASMLGRNKAEIVATFVYHLNPYAHVHLFDEGVTDENIDEFLDEVDVLVEETDNLEMKIKLRVAAKERNIPVVMATDNGDNVVVDVERYDLHDDLKIFNGVAGDLTVEQFRSFPPQDLPKLAATIAGTEFTVPRMHESLLEVGKTLYSWPQLGSAATLSGVVLAYIIRRIINGDPVKEGKFEINLDALIDPEYHSESALDARNEIRENFLRRMGMDEV